MTAADHAVLMRRNAQADAATWRKHPHAMMILFLLE
jgi:hypothetical protein